LSRRDRLAAICLVLGTLLRHGGPDVSVLVVPWQLEAPETKQTIAEEEPQAA
jgi:hypothetical protein